MNKFIKTCKLPKLESLRYKETKQTYTSKEIQIVIQNVPKGNTQNQTALQEILPNIYRKINASYSHTCPKILTQREYF